MCRLGLGFSPSLDSAWHKHEIVLVRINCSGVFFWDTSNKDGVKMIAGELGDFNIITTCLEEPDI